MAAAASTELENDEHHLLLLLLDPAAQAFLLPPQLKSAPTLSLLGPSLSHTTPLFLVFQSQLKHRPLNMEFYL